MKEEISSQPRGAWENARQRPLKDLLKDESTFGSRKEGFLGEGHSCWERVRGLSLPRQQKQRRAVAAAWCATETKGGLGMHSM